MEPEVHDGFATDLTRDLQMGAWDERHGELRHQPTFDGSLVLVVAAL